MEDRTEQDKASAEGAYDLIASLAEMLPRTSNLLRDESLRKTAVEHLTSIIGTAYLQGYRDGSRAQLETLSQQIGRFTG